MGTAGSRKRSSSAAEGTVFPLPKGSPGRVGAGGGHSDDRTVSHSVEAVELSVSSPAGPTAGSGAATPSSMMKVDSTRLGSALNVAAAPATGRHHLDPQYDLLTGEKLPPRSLIPQPLPDAASEDSSVYSDVGDGDMFFGDVDDDDDDLVGETGSRKTVSDEFSGEGDPAGAERMFGRHRDYNTILLSVFERARLREDQQARFLAALQTEEYPQHAHVVTQGEMGDKFFIIESGEVEVVDEPAGQRPRLLCVLYEGHHFGEFCLLREQARNASVIVRSPKVVVKYLRRDQFAPFVAEDPRFEEVITQLVADIEKRRKRREQMKDRTAPQRVVLVPRHINMMKTLHRSRNTDRQVVVNHYTLLSKLGSGTYGQVHLCEDVNDHKRYAIKIINKAKLRRRRLGRDDPRGMREVEVLMNLTHANVVQLVEVIDDAAADSLYMVQELMQLGPVLTDQESNQPLPENTLWLYMRDVLRGLEYVHFQHVAHRDIKPSNVLISQDGRAKLGDFGVAVIVAPSGKLNIRGAEGTPAFMAPELFREGVSHYDPYAADIYSLGVTMYTCALGYPPIMADNEMELARKVQIEDPNLPRGILHPSLRNLLRRMLAKNPSNRITLPEIMAHEWVTCEGSEPFPPHEYVHIAMQAAPSGGSPMSAGGGPDDFAMASPSSSTAGRGAAAGAGSAMSPVPKPGDRVTQMAVVEEEDADGEAAAAAAASADSPTSGRRPGSRSGSRKTKRPGSASSRLSNSSLSSPTSSTSTPPRVPRDGASPGGGSSAASARGSTSSKRGRHSMPAKKSRSHAQLRTRAMLSPVMETPPPRMTRSTSSGSGHSSVSHRSRNISNAQHERALHMFRLQRRQQHLLFNSSPFMGKELDTLQEQKRVIRGHTEAMTTELVLEDGPDGWRDPSAGAGSKTTAVNLGEVAAWSPTHPRDTIELSDLGKLLYGEAVPPELLRRFTRQVAGSTHGSRSTRHTLHRTMSEGSLVFSAYKMSSGASTTDISGNRSEQSNVSSPLGGSVSTNSVHTTPHKLQARGPPPKSKIVLSPSAQAFLDCTFRGPHVFTPRQSPHLESPPRGSRRHRGHHDIRRSFSHHVRQTTVDSMTRTSPLAAGGGGLTRTGMAAPVVSPHSGTFGGNMSPTAAAAFANAAANAGLADSNPNSGTAGNGGGATAGGAGTSATPTQPGASAGAGDGGVFSTPAASSPATSAAPSASGTPQSQPNGGPPSSSLSSSRLMKTPSTANSSGGPPADEDVLATPMSAPVDGSSSSKPPRLRRISEASANRKWMPSLPSHAAPKTLGARRRSLGMMPMELDAVAAAAGHYLSTPSDADLGALIKPYPASASAGKHPKTPQPGPSPGGDQPPSSDEKDGGAMGRRRLTRHKDFLMVTESFGKNAQGGTVKKAVIFRPKDEHRMSLASAGDAKVGGLYSRTMHRAGQQGRRAALGVHLSALDEASVETSESEHGASGGTGSDDSDSDWGSDCEAVEELDEVLGDLCKPVVDHDSDLDALSDVGDVDDDDDDDDDSDSDVGELLSGDDALAGLGLDGDVASDDEATADGDGGAGAGAGAGAACREPRRSAAATAAERLSITAAKHLCNNRLRLTYGAAENQGGRESMEDCTTALVDMNAAVGLPEGTPAVAYFGVYDGHNGDDTSNFLAKELHLNVAASESFLTDPSEALRAGFLATDKEIVEGQETKEAMGINFKFSGSTAIVCLVRAPGAGLPLQLIVANVGDCRAVLSRAGQATELSSDQTPSREDEHARIVAAGGWVHNGRLNSVLAVSRAFGDVEHKSLKERCWERTFVSDPLIATPEIRVETVEPQDEFVILASDGVWDSLTSQQAVNFVRKRLVEHQNAERAASELLHKALSLTSTDNATAVVICLNQKLDDRQVDEAVASVPSVASLISAAEEESKEFGGGGGAAEVEVSYDVGYGGVDSDDNDGSSSESDYSDVGSLGSLPG